MIRSIIDLFSDPEADDLPVEETDGIVFDIQRSSPRDGFGIRTTVFLKGCPLRCRWCPNPESNLLRPQLAWSSDRCIDCFACLEVCPNQVHRRSSDGWHGVVFDRCLACGACAGVCPVGGLSVIGRSMRVSDVMAEIRRDRADDDKSGGALTVSGGEPMTQYRFTRALLEVAHEDGLHTCLETSGFAPWDRYRSILPWVDHILVDYKASGSGRHAELTGVPNEKILENIEAIYCTGVAMTIRCPLIPGLNDTEDHLAAIAGLGKRYPGIDRIELMPYHATGQEKSARIGESPRWVGADSASEDDRNRWLDVIRSHGCDRVVFG